MVKFALLFWLALGVPGLAQDAETLYQTGLRQYIQANRDPFEFSVSRRTLERSFRLRSSAKAAYYLAWIAHKEKRPEEALRWSRRALLLQPDGFHSAGLFLSLRPELYRPDLEEKRALRIQSEAYRRWEQFLLRFTPPVVEPEVRPAEVVSTDRLVGPTSSGPAVKPPGEGDYRFAVEDGGVELRKQERLVWSFRPSQKEPARLYVFPSRVLLATPTQGYWLERATGRLLGGWPAQVGGTVCDCIPYDDRYACIQGAGRTKVQIHSGQYFGFVRVSDGGGWANFVSWHYASMLSPEENQVFGTYPTGKVEARDADTGALQWSVPMETPRLLACGRLEVWVLGEESCTVHCFDRRSGRLLWSRDHRGQLPSGLPR